MATLDDLATPALILDRSRLTRNLARLRAVAEQHGVALRPHLKTAKSVEVAQLAVGQGGPIAVSTWAEADGFSSAGFRDLTLPVGFVPFDVARLHPLRRRGVRISLLIDNDDSLLALQRYAARTLQDRQDPPRRTGSEPPIPMDQNEEQPLLPDIGVLIEIDPAYHRAGRAPSDPWIVTTAQSIRDSPGLRFDGVLTHAGHAYGADSTEAITAIAGGERDAVVEAATRLREAGVPCPIVSAGSTPTAIHGADWTGVTELRAGVYMFGDLDQVGLGTCTVADIAASVLTRVRGHYPERNELVVDAGAIAMSLDTRGNRRLPSSGYGWVCDVRGRVLEPLRLTRLSQEHGVIAPLDAAGAVLPADEEPLPYHLLPVGTPLRILPHHACLTAAQFPAYHVIDGPSIDVKDNWTRLQYW